MKRSLSMILLILFIVLVIIALVIAMIALNRAPTSGPITIGIIIANEERYEKIAGFKAGLEELGYTTDQDIRYKTIDLEGKREIDSILINEIQEMQADVLVTTGVLETEIAKNYTTNIPIVYIGIASPESLGIVTSPLITGIDNGQMKLIGKRLELIRHWLPTAKKVLILADREAATTERALVAVSEAVQKIDIEIEVLRVASNIELKKEIENFTLGMYDAILPLPSFLLEDILTDYVPLLIEKRLFVLGSYPEQVKKGLFAAYGVSFVDQGKQAAYMVAKLLNKQSLSPTSVVPDSISVTIHKSNLDRLNLHLTDQQLSVVNQFNGEE